MTDSQTARRAPARRALLVPALVAIVAACSPTAPGATSTPGGATSSPPSQPATTGPSPTTSGISHPTGAKEIVLRSETGGGFVAPQFLVTEAPSFSLYGDGTVIFRNPDATPPDPVGNVVRGVPFQVAKLSEQQVQTLLEFAIGPGGLGLAQGPYIFGADIPTTTFTIHAAGGEKTVSVSGFVDDPQGKDAAIIAALKRLNDRLTAFASEIPDEQIWSPERYRGILEAMDQAPSPPLDWPWTSIKPGDFVQANGAFFPTRVMSKADVDTLAIAAVQGGMQGLVLKTSDGKIYMLALRPLLPDEES